MSALRDDEPCFERVGRLVGDRIIWFDGRPPTTWPQDTDTKPAVTENSEKEQ